MLQDQQTIGREEERRKEKKRTFFGNCFLCNSHLDVSIYSVDQTQEQHRSF